MTTILNAANLFGDSTLISGNTTSQNNNSNSNKTTNATSTTIAQQELYSSGAQFHLNQPFSTMFHNHHNNSHHHHHSQQQQHNQNHHHHHHQPHHNHHQQQQQQQYNTLYEQSYPQNHSHSHSHNQQQQHNYYSIDEMILGTILRKQNGIATRGAQHYQNPLLSSISSSTYNRQASDHLPSLPSMSSLPSLPPLPPRLNPSNKSTLQSNRTLNFTPANNKSSLFGYDYQLIFKSSILLVLLALCSILIIKFASFNQAKPAPPIYYSQNPLNYQTKVTEPSNAKAPMSGGPPDGLYHAGGLLTAGQTMATNSAEIIGQAPDSLKSKLVIGQFVVLSQNYTSSLAQKSLLAENIVKLMDQVFLSTDVRRVYSRMDINSIGAYKPSGGIVVDCRITLSESIAYAAQQFGLALFESLTRTNGKLSDHPSFIIDKNSIRLNTVPDKDLAIAPPGLIPATFQHANSAINTGLAGLTQPIGQLAPAGQANRQPSDPLEPTLNGNLGGLMQPQAPVSEENAVVWSEWSQWSSCVDKNGLCDATRLHSRIRRCVSQNTGEKVDPDQCRSRFGMQDQDLEVSDCSQNCLSQPNAGTDSHIMSDAPSVISPQTAPPSVMIASNDRDSPPTFILPAPLGVHRGLGLKPPGAKLPGQLLDSLNTNSGPLNRGEQQQGLVPSDGPYPPSMPSSTPLAIVSSQPTPADRQSTTEQGLVQPVSQSSVVVNSDMTPFLPAPQLDNRQQQQMSCSNCTTDEICLLLVTQKVPFCAKIKDRLDESGCGGWCKVQGQLCEAVGQNAFKCIHDSECLRDEWRCHDSACIPLSKRCDGHSNCYDNSDERDCPNPNR